MQQNVKNFIFKAETIFFKEIGYLFDSIDFECCGSNFWVDEVNKVESHKNERFNKVLIMIG